MIVSKLNERVKRVASLKQNKYRNEYNKYFIEGVKLAKEILDSEKTKDFSEFDLSEIWYCETMLNNAVGGKELLTIMKKQTIEIVEVDEKVFKFIADTDTPQGVILVFNKKNLSYEQLLQTLEENQSYIILDKITDAGNMGTIIRTCLSFDTVNIICTKETVDIYNPKVIRSTMGAILKVKVWYLTMSEIKDIVNQMKSKGYIITATSLMATETTNAQINNKAVFVMGNEANGISNELENMCDISVKIPMSEKQESLNVAIATGILLYLKYISK